MPENLKHYYDLHYTCFDCNKSWMAKILNIICPRCRRKNIYFDSELSLTIEEMLKGIK